MLGLGQWVEQCNLTVLGYRVLSNIYIHSLVLWLTAQCLAFITSIYLLYTSCLLCAFLFVYCSILTTTTLASHNDIYYGAPIVIERPG